MYHMEQRKERTMQEIDVRGTTTASPDEVWRLLDDSSTWPSWTTVDGHERERERGADGLGEIRAFTTGRYTVREEIVERAANRRLSYALLSGLPLRDYRADIDLTPNGAGTDIRWHTTFRPKVPGTGWMFRRGLDKLTRQFVDGLAKAAT
jgi:hypothetical protein